MPIIICKKAPYGRPVVLGPGDTCPYCKKAVGEHERYEYEFKIPDGVEPSREPSASPEPSRERPTSVPAHSSEPGGGVEGNVRQARRSGSGTTPENGDAGQEVGLTPGSERIADAPETMPPREGMSLREAAKLDAEELG